MHEFDKWRGWYQTVLDLIVELEVHVKIYKNHLSALDLFMYLFYFLSEK